MHLIWCEITAEDLFGKRKKQALIVEKIWRIFQQDVTLVSAPRSALKTQAIFREMCSELS